jgi:hypothetical protein
MSHKPCNLLRVDSEVSFEFMNQVHMLDPKDKSKQAQNMCTAIAYNYKISNEP